MASHSSILAWRIPWTVAPQGPLSMIFSRQEYWSGLLRPPPGDLPNSGIEPEPPVAPALQANSLLLSHRGSPICLVFPYDSIQPSPLLHIFFYGLIHLKFISTHAYQISADFKHRSITVLFLISLWVRFGSRLSDY